MNDGDIAPILQALLAREEIRDALCRYARGVDRGDWELVRSVYHPDAHDDHVEYAGGVAGLIEWLDRRFSGVDNSTHFLGNCLIELDGGDRAFVESYFVSSRVMPPDGSHSGPGLSVRDGLRRQAWGRYLDRFERRDGIWRIADRRVVIDARFTSVAIGGARVDGRFWGLRNTRDPLYERGSEAQ